MGLDNFRSNITDVNALSFCSSLVGLLYMFIWNLFVALYPIFLSFETFSFLYILFSFLLSQVMRPSHTTQVSKSHVASKRLTKQNLPKMECPRNSLSQYLQIYPRRPNKTKQSFHKVTRDLNYSFYSYVGPMRYMYFLLWSHNVFLIEVCNPRPANFT